MRHKHKHRGEDGERKFEIEVEEERIQEGGETDTERAGSRRDRRTEKQTGKD